MIRLHELTIQAFRGVPDMITLDLSAPLTLIYAPNGSGKTTICEAAEWLLTGIVKRLKTAAAEDDNIRCRFSDPSTPTLVSATLEIGTESIVLERKVSGCRWKIGTGRWSNVTPSNLLEKLAPGAAQDGVHRGHANPSRQTWLRGTRFLSGEALSTLLDSDDDSISGRQQLFADLLGVGHLLETERLLGAYIDEMGQNLRKQQARVNDKDAEIHDRESKLSDQIDENRKDRLATALAYIHSAYDLLQRESTEERPTTRTAALSSVATLRADLEGRKVLWNQRRQAELSLATDWPQRVALDQFLIADQARISALSVESSSNATALALATGQLQTLTADAARHRATIDTLENRDRGLADAQAQARPLLLQYLEKLGHPDLGSDAAFAIVDSEGVDKTRTLRLEALRAVLAELPATVSLTQQRDILKHEYEAASAAAPSSEAVTVTRTLLTAAAEHVAVLNTAYERAAGPFEQLRHLSVTVIAALGHDESACPVCAHDWKSATALKQALTATAKATPASLTALDQQLREARAQNQNLQDRLLHENQLLARAVEAERAYRGIEGVLSAFAAKVHQAGLEANDGGLQIKAELAIARINLVAVLRALRDEYRAAETSVAQSLASDESVLELHARLHPVLAAAITVARLALDEAEQQRQAAQTVVTTATEAIRKLESEREAVTRRIQQNGGRLQVLKSSWQTLAGDRDWTDVALSDISTGLRSDYDAQQNVERILVQAEMLLRELGAVEELETLRAERKPLVAERDQLNKHAETALAIRTAYQDSRQKHVKQQMADFVRVISALFTRMQSNLVYDDVVSGEEGAPLSWRAIAEDYSLDPEATFSQGQRQDFALSIFLARARGLGGTFILDEPVAHLDDLNRVALLDVFRAITLENTTNLSFVLTTANKPLVRHMAEKFARVGALGSPPNGPTESVLRLVGIEGNPRSGVKLLQGAELSASL